ncbi:MAG: hypothetical protein HZC49_05825 [Nitrospirae bacterium]|nr:hypothetical protein [Nitrospirota bacterium]
MKILHIINNGMTDLTKSIIDAQSKDHEIKVVKLSQKGISYEAVVDDIFSCDKVVSW